MNESFLNFNYDGLQIPEDHKVLLRRSLDVAVDRQKALCIKNRNTDITLFNGTICGSMDFLVVPVADHSKYIVIDTENHNGDRTGRFFIHGWDVVK